MVINPAEFATIFDIEEAVIECRELWRRTPGGGRWPYAGDGPWWLIRWEWGDYGGDGQDGVSSSVRPRTPLDAGEVDRRDAVTAWLTGDWLADRFDAMLVWEVTGRLWRGEGRVHWRDLARQVGWQRSPEALARRYRRALATILCRLTGQGAQLVKALAEVRRDTEVW